MWACGSENRVSNKTRRKEKRKTERSVKGGGEDECTPTLRAKGGSCGTASVRHFSRNCKACFEVTTVVLVSPNICCKDDEK